MRKIGPFVVAVAIACIVAVFTVSREKTGAVVSVDTQELTDMLPAKTIHAPPGDETGEDVDSIPDAPPSDRTPNPAVPPEVFERLKAYTAEFVERYNAENAVQAVPVVANKGQPDEHVRRWERYMIVEQCRWADTCAASPDELAGYAIFQQRAVEAATQEEVLQKDFESFRGRLYLEYRYANGRWAYARAEFQPRSLMIFRRPIDLTEYHEETDTGAAGRGL